jgi:hypothetical protein
MKTDPSEENIKNYFAPNMRNKYFSINDIIDCLRHGFMQMNKLPPEIADRVHVRLVRLKSKENLQHSWYWEN